MADESVEAEGRTVNEATDAALEQLGLRRDQVDIEVLTEGRPRLLGFLGEPARVRVTLRREVMAPPPVRPARDDSRRTEVRGEEPSGEEEDDEDEEYDDEDGEDGEDGDEDEDEDEDENYEDEDEEDELPVELRNAQKQPVAPVTPVPLNEADTEIAVQTLDDLLSLMGVEASVQWREPETPGDGVGMIEAVLDIEGEDLGILIGRRGQTLVALQYLLNLIVSKKVDRRVSFGVDVDGYRRRREETLVSLARRMASRVRSSGRSQTLEPMPPNERRIIHITLADDPAVMTVSIGEGEERKVAITPTR